MDQLGLNVQGLVAQIINFGLLMALLTVLLYGPVRRMLDKRTAKIREGLEKAEEMKLASERSQQESAAVVEESRREAQVILGRAESIAAKIRQEAQASAKEEANLFLDRARSEIEREKQAAVAEIKSQVGDLAVLAAGKILGERVDQAAHARIIEETLKEARWNN